MKKGIIIIISVIVLLFIRDKLYKSYRLHFLTNDRAVLFVYSNIKYEDYASYFHVNEKDMENAADFYIHCVVPNYESSFLINNKTNDPLKNIN